MNLVVVPGNLTQNPELRYTQEGVPVATIRLASDAPNGETLFINAACWEKLGEAVAERLRKGDKCVVFGRLQPESWTAKDGSKRSTISIRATNVEFMSSREDADDAIQEVVPRALDNAPEPTELPF